MKLRSLHVKVPYMLRLHLTRQARKEGLPLSVYVRRLLYEVSFNQIANLQGEIVNGKHPKV